VLQPVLVVGLGQLGCLFSEGFLRLGHPVIPVLRGDSLPELYGKHSPCAILVATGEDDLPPVLQGLPPEAKNRVTLIQNELRPAQWLEHQVNPTVAVVWFEKRKGKAPHVVLPSVLSGEMAPWMTRCFAKLDLPCRTVSTMNELYHELVFKNLYILGLNLAGLGKVDGISPQQARDLVSSHQDLFSNLLTEILALEFALLQEAVLLYPSAGLGEVHLDKEKLYQDLLSAIQADPDHNCAGRSARRRLARALEHARRLSLPVPLLESLAASNS
jgi:hypothetical protein